MIEHQRRVHPNILTPTFSFKVVANAKTALERQVREGVRIHLRGAVLNKSGV